MLILLRRYWFLLPVFASLATECGESPRGAIPTPIVAIDLTLNSVPAPPPADQTEFSNCLNRMGGLQNHVRPSWRANAVTLLEETAPNVFNASFPDVPAGFQNTMTVHDTNECARDPEGQGHVTSGVTVNDVQITRDLGGGVLTFMLQADGTVIQ